MNIFYDNYKGRIAVGRVVNGIVKQGAQIKHIDREGKEKMARITALQIYDGLGRTDVPQAQAGEIVVLAGIENVQIGESLVDPVEGKALPVLHIEEPTVKMTFGANTSPFAGNEGEFSTARHLKERLEKELLNDVALKIEKGEGDSQFVVSGRGELHLAILIEKMRREGYELQVSRPQVIFKEVDGVTMEPYEAVSIECPEAFTGTVIEKMGKRRGEMKDMLVEPSTSSGQERRTSNLKFQPADSSATAVNFDRHQGAGHSQHAFAWLPRKGRRHHRHGSRGDDFHGEWNHHGIFARQPAGARKFVCGSKYRGVCGHGHWRKFSPNEDMEVNPCKEKKLSNMRSKGDGGEYCP